MVYRDFKDITRRTASYKISHNKAFNITKNPKYGGYQRDLASMLYKFFHKSSSAMRAWSEALAMQNKFAGSCIKNENMSNKELHSPFISNIWGADLANMQLICKFNKKCRFL